MRPFPLLLVIRAAGWLLASRLGLALFGFGRMRRWIDGLAATPAGLAPEAAAWAVNGIAARLPAMGCLPRALALHALLRRAGLASEIRLGVAREGEGMRAHAWVALEGRALASGDDPERFAVLPSLPR